MDQWTVRVEEFFRNLLMGLTKNQPDDERPKSMIMNVNEYLVQRVESVKNGELPLGELLLDLYNMREYPQHEVANKMWLALSTKNFPADLLRLMVNCKEVKGFVDVRDRCKHAYVVSVIFSFVPGFLNVFSSDAELFNILFGYFDQSQVLTSPVTNYVVDVLNGVLREQPKELLAECMKHPQYMDKLMKHISSSSVAEFLLQVVNHGNHQDTARVPGDNTVAVFELLEKVQFEDKVIKCFLESADAMDTDPSAEKNLEPCIQVLAGLYGSISEMPKEIRLLPLVKQFNPLVNVEPLDTMMKRCISIAQSRKSSEDALGHVLKLWMEILSAVFIQKKATGSAASIPKAAAIDLDSSLLERKLTENSESLLKFLDDALEEAAEMSAMGKPPTRLGRLRVQIVEVFVTAFKICGKDARQVLYDLNVQRVLFELMVAYPSSSIVHSLVAVAVEVSLCPQRPTAIKAWLSTFCLPRRILDIWNAQREQFFQDREVPAYLSAFVRICMHIRNFLERVGPDGEIPLDQKTRDDFNYFALHDLLFIQTEFSKPLDGSPRTSISMDHLHNMYAGVTVDDENDIKNQRRLFRKSLGLSDSEDDDN